MGEGTGGLNPEDEIDQASARVEQSRARLDGLVSELDQRRHVVANLKRRAKEHPLLAIAAGVLGVGLVGGAVVLAVQRRRQAETLPERAARMRRALARKIDVPVARPSALSAVAIKLLEAGALAGAKLLAKRLLRANDAPLQGDELSTGGEASVPTSGRG